MSVDEKVESIFQAKLAGKSDEEIMREFSIGLRDIEQAVITKTGLNLNLFKTKRKVALLSPKNFELESTTVWSFKQRGKWATHNGNYRGNWSPYIPRNIILQYSSPGDTILDPFCGGGTTAVEAKLLGRECIARDINPGAIMLTRQNLEFDVVVQDTLSESEFPEGIFEPDVSIGDARHLSDIANESIDLICTHPPYADIVNYSENIDGDLSLLDVEKFLLEMGQVASQFMRVLKPNGTCVILIGDTRKNKRVIPMGFQTIERFLSVGFSLKDLIIKRQHNCRTTGFWYTSSIKHNFLLLSQEYLPVFTKQGSNKQERYHKLKPLYPLISSSSKPKIPDSMQCKTTWVLETKNWENELESNLLNRYGGEGNIIEVELVNKEGARIPDQIDLVYFRPTPEILYSPKLLEQYLQVLRKLVPELHGKIKPDGHLAIRLKDFRDGNHLYSPSLDSWKIPLDYFKIREIIVVTSDIVKEQSSENEMSIEHEIILIYQA